MLLPFLILACICYLTFAVTSTAKGKQDSKDIVSSHPIVKYIFAGGVPVVVALTMTYLFLIVGGATAVQFNAGNPSAMNVWSTWVGLWPVFIVMTAASGLGTLIWTIACMISKQIRPSIVASVASFSLSVLAFFTVVSYFPSA